MPTITLTFPSPYPSAVTMTSLTRADTGDAVSFTAAWTDAGSGVFTNAFTAPSPGLTYNYTATATIGGVATPFEYSYSDVSSGYTGRYCSSASLKREYKTANVNSYSQGDGSTATANETAIQDAIKWAEDGMDGIFSGGSYAVPLTATGSSLPRQIQGWAHAGAIYWLYRIRGLNDTKEGNAFGKLWEDAQKEMALYAGGLRHLAGVAYRTGATSNTIAIVEPTVASISSGAGLFPTDQSTDFGRRYVQGIGYVIQG